MKPNRQLLLAALVALPLLPSTAFGGNGSVAEIPRITLELRDTDVRDALRLVAKQGGINLVLSKGVEGAVTLELDQVTLRETLDAIVEVAGLQYSMSDNIVTVTTYEELENKQKQETDAPLREVLVLELRYVDAERMISVIEDLLGEEGTVSLLNTSDHIAQGYESEAQAPETGGESGLQIGTQLSTSTQGQPARSHTLVVVDHPARLREVKKVVDRIDKKPVQVLIEARFVEVTLGATQDLGVDWNVAFGANGAATPHTFPFGNSSLGEFTPSVTGGSPNGVFPPAPNSVTTPTMAGLFTFGTLDFSSFAGVLEAIQTDSRVQLVSNPHIVVGDRHTATILVGERYPILSANVSEFGSVTEQLDRYEPIGVQLEVTPSVLNDDEIELFVRPSTSSLGALVSGSTGLSVARINSRQIDTSVTIKDQQTVVLGGLITSREVNTTSEVPFLGSVPLLGKLFRHESTETERVDLVVFLTVAIQQEYGLSDQQRELFDSTSYGVIERNEDSAKGELAYSLSAPRY